MAKPNITIGSSVGFKKEATAGTKIALTGGYFLDILSASLKYTTEKYSEHAIMGTRIQGTQSEVASHYNANGGFSCRARASYLAALIEMILGRNSGSGVYAPILDNADLSTYTFEGNVANANTIRLAGCKANEMTFKSEAGQPLIIDATLIGMNGERNPGDLTTPDYSGWLTQGLFMHSNMTFAATNATWLGGSTVNEIRAIELAIKNNLGADDFTNSTTRQYIPQGLFEAALKLTVPYNGTTKGFWEAVAGLDIITITSTWTDGDNTLTVTYKCRCDTDLPDISEVGSKYLELEFHAVSESNTDDVLTMKVA